MAYLSGSAVFIRNTRRSDQKNLWCGGVSMSKDTFNYNFGTKVSQGTVSILCQLVNVD